MDEQAQAKQAQRNFDTDKWVALALFKHTTENNWTSFRNQMKSIADYATDEQWKELEDMLAESAPLWRWKYRNPEAAATVAPAAPATVALASEAATDIEPVAETAGAQA